MSTTATMATLLKRSDAPLYRIHVGVDCIDFVQRMCLDHCFDLTVVLHAPFIPISEGELTAYIQRLDCHIGKAWFNCSWAQAVAIFGAVLVGPDVHIDPPCVESAVQIDPPCVDAAHTIMEKAVDDLTEGTESDGSDDASMVDDPIWGFVSPCSTREASKSAAIRSDLVLRLGKDRAVQLLAKATATVVRDSEGKKNRVLRVGERFLKVKPR